MRTLLLFLLLLPAAAAAVTVKPIGVRTVYSGVDGVTKYADVITKMTSQTYGTQYAIKKVPISAATLGKLAKAALRGPLGLAITSAMLLKDVVWDSQNDTFSEPAAVSCDDLAVGVDCSAHVSYITFLPNCNTQYFPDLGSAISCIMSQDPSDDVFSSVAWVEDSKFRVYTYRPSEDVVRKHTSIYPSYGPPDVPSDPLPGQPVSDTDVGQAIADSVQSGEFPTDIASDIAADAVQSGSWVTDWPELQSQVANDFALLEGVDAGTDTLPPDAEAAQKTEAEQSLELQKEMADDLDAIRKNREQQKDEELPPIPSLPDVDGIDVETITLPELSTTEIVSPVPGGSCPPPIEFFALGNDYSVSLQPVCDLAATMRPFLIALAWLLAAFVALGQSKSVS